jgi:hypothetical protein
VANLGKQYLSVLLPERLSSVPSRARNHSRPKQPPQILLQRGTVDHFTGVPIRKPLPRHLLHRPPPGLPKAGALTPEVEARSLFAERISRSLLSKHPGNGMRALHQPSTQPLTSEAGADADKEIEQGIHGDSY